MVDECEDSLEEREPSLDPAPPTTVPSADPADYDHTILTTSPGISRKRPKLVIPSLRNQLTLIPTLDHRPSSAADSLPKSQLHSLLGPPSQGNVSPSLPHTPLEQIAHTPLLPPEIPRFVRAKSNLRVTLAHRSSPGYNTPTLSPYVPQDPTSPLFHPLDAVRPRNSSANPRPLLRPRQLSYFNSISAGPDSSSSPKVSDPLDISSGVLRTESLASPLILFQPTTSFNLGPAL